MNPTLAARCSGVQLVTQVLEGKDNTLSLINVVENVRILKTMLGMALPLEAISFWDFDRSVLNHEIETKVVIKNVHGEILSETISKKLLIESDSKDDVIRARIRAKGINIPKEFGTFKLFMSWRDDTSDNWQESSGYWYFSLAEFVPNKDESRE